MVREKIKKYSIRFGIAFFIILALLTYFSATIDNMLLPQVKVSEIIPGTIDGKNSDSQKYLIPKSSVTDEFGSPTVFVIDSSLEDSQNAVVNEIAVTIDKSNDLYYEVTGSDISSSFKVVYSASKDIYDNDRVYIIEEE